MKFIKELINQIAYIFTAVVLIISFLTYCGVVYPLSLVDSVSTLFIMALCTALIVVTREHFMSENSLFKTFIGVLGCAVVVFLIGYVRGWFKLNFDYVIFILAITVAVYLVVWTICLIQNKRDADELNSQLNRINNKK